MTRPLRRLQGWWRQHELVVRRPARLARRFASAQRSRLRSLLRQSPPRVVPIAAGEQAAPLPHPAILVHPGAADRAELERFLARQTESSVTCDPVAGADAPFLFLPDRGLDRPEPTHLEALLLAAVAGDSELAVSGWSAPAAGGESLMRRPQTVSDASLTLLRRPEPGRQRGRCLRGCLVRHVTADEALAAMTAMEPPGIASGLALLDGSVRSGRVIRQRLHPLLPALADLPAVDGPRTALFLLPFLAVGGAEKLLFDLLERLAARYRLLVVTLEPHRPELGQTVDRCRAITPHVYTLGDWLPREAHHQALLHLLRRWRVESLVSWNGTTWFFDHVGELRRRQPALRILCQLFNHQGGWFEHYCPRVVASVDLHLAVNDRIAAALASEWGVPGDHIAVVHHAVRVPPEPGVAAADEQRRLREALGLPLDRTVVGTFVRLHPQKRPLDVLELAWRMQTLPVHFLLVGGGPLDAEVDRALAARPLANLTRLEMRRDTESIYAALDVCLLTSAYEGLPVFLLDGLARGIPCVATAVGEVPELLADGGGFAAARPGDLGTLAAGLEQLLDPELRRTEGRAGRETVIRRFGLERYVREYEAAIFPGAG